MAERNRTRVTWRAAAGVSLVIAGCNSAPKNPLAATPPAPVLPAATAVSGSGEFAPDTGCKNPAKIHLAYGQWQEQMGQQAEARESYARVLAEQPKNIEALLGIARLDQAAGLYGDAEERLKKATKIAPRDSRVLATYGNFYSAQGEWRRAIEKQQAAVKHSPDDPRYQFLLGVALTRSGDAEAAYPYFVRSVGDAQAHYNVGYILYETGDRAGAMHHFEQALAINPDLAIAQTMLDRVQQRSDKPILANGTGQGQTAAPATPASSVRSIPLTTQEELVPLKGNEASLPRGFSRSKSTTPEPTWQPPSGLTDAQQEQLRNQQGQ